MDRGNSSIRNRMRRATATSADQIEIASRTPLRAELDRVVQTPWNARAGYQVTNSFIKRELAISICQINRTSTTNLLVVESVGNEGGRE